MMVIPKTAVMLCMVLTLTASGFAPSKQGTLHSLETSLKFFKGGSGAKDLEEEWKAQQELLKLRNASPEVREKYFQDVEERRVKISQEQVDKWAWQKKQYNKGEDPIDEWRKRRASGEISDLENQYGDPKEVGGIPLPIPSFGVGGEFGVGGKYDNGGRFDLRLPYVEQGWVDEEAEPGFFNWFGKKTKVLNAESESQEKSIPNDQEAGKNPFWPF